MKKTLFAAAALFALVGAAHAETVAESGGVANSIIFRGSAVCDHSWLDRPGALKMLALARSGNFSDAKIKKLLVRGFNDFDRSVQQLGKAGACQKLDRMIDALGD